MKSNRPVLLMLLTALVVPTAIAPYHGAAGGDAGGDATPTPDQTTPVDGPEEAVGPAGLSGTTLAILIVLAVVVIAGIVMAVSRRNRP